jgi:hypothetical protein
MVALWMPGAQVHDIGNHRHDPTGGARHRTPPVGRCREMLNESRAVVVSALGRWGD